MTETKTNKIIIKGECFYSSTCGAYNYCKINDFLKCGGPIKSNETSKEIFDKIMPKFKPGRCNYCGEDADVTQVNENFTACKECWIFFIAPQRTIEDLTEDLTKER